jgi:hypothetical protein
VLAVLLVGGLDLATTAATARHAGLGRLEIRQGQVVTAVLAAAERLAGSESTAVLLLARRLLAGRRCGRRVQALGLARRIRTRRAGARAAAAASALRSASALRAAIAAARAFRFFLFLLLAARRGALAQDLRIEILFVFLLDFRLRSGGSAGLPPRPHLPPAPLPAGSSALRAPRLFRLPRLVRPLAVGERFALHVGALLAHLDVDGLAPLGTYPRAAC